jgi:hypothetical protein
MPLLVTKHGFWWVYKPTPIVVSPPTVDNAVPGQPYTVTFTATGGSAPTSPYTFSYTGTLPDGLTLDPVTGELSGTPTTEDTFTFTIIATDANGYTGSQEYTIIISMDRSILKSTNVLIVWDPNSVHGGLYGYDVNPADIALIIAARETALGFTPTTISSYGDLVSTDITNYAHIWDVGYDTLMTTAVANQYKAYLQTGGAAFLLGENGIFVDRDDTIDNFVSSYMGGGTVDATNWDPNASINATVAAEFLLSNSNNSVTFNRPGRFDTIGTGTAMATSIDGTHAAVWKTGSLSESPTGAICSVLDINFVVGSGDPDFIDNVSIVLNKK